MNGNKFIPNQVSVLISFGIAGFLIGLLMLGGKGCNGNIRYKEIMLVNKDTVIRQLYSKRLTRLRDTMRRMEADTAKYAKAIPPAHKAFVTTLRDSIAFSAGNADTSLKWFSNLITVNRDSLSKAINSAEWKADSGYAMQVRFTYTDTTAALYKRPFVETVTMKLQGSRYKSLMHFFAANTLAAFWLVFSIAQSTLWFLVVPLLYGMLRSLKGKVTGAPGDILTASNWVISSVLPLLFFGLFGPFFYWYLIDDTVIKDHYFMQGFYDKMRVYAGFGYIAAIACFGMYLLTSLSLDQLNKNAKANQLSLTDDDTLKNNYNTLKRTFDNSFLASAIILSVFVLWVGITFSAVNQTEGMRFYTLYSGKPFLPYDYVYLIGALHTVILLLFYIPVRVKFNSMQITAEAKAAGTEPGTKVLKNLYDSIIAILVTASPLIASVIQKLLAGVVGS